MSTSSTSPNSSLTGSPALLTLVAAIGMILLSIPCLAVAVPVSASIKSDAGEGHRHRRRTIVNGSTAGLTVTST